MQKSWDRNQLSILEELPGGQVDWRTLRRGEGKKVRLEVCRLRLDSAGVLLET